TLAEQWGRNYRPIGEAPLVALAERIFRVSFRSEIMNMDRAPVDNHTPHDGAPVDRTRVAERLFRQRAVGRRQPEYLLIHAKDERVARIAQPRSIRPHGIQDRREVGWGAADDAQDLAWRGPLGTGLV